MDYADRIRALREDKNFTQTQIADILNVGQKTYSDYELRKIRIPMENLIILAQLYNVSLDYICGFTDERNPFPKK